MRLHRGNFFLVGLMGAGKTTLGRRLAIRLNKTFVDCDVELEHRLGCTISDIFEREGEISFRNREEVLLKALVQRENTVLGTGGGAVLREVNRERLRAHGTVVYLHARPETLAERLQNATNRPLLKTSEGILTRLQRLYEIRDPLYRETAHYIFESTPDVVDRLIDALSKE